MTFFAIKLIESFDKKNRGSGTVIHNYGSGNYGNLTLAPPAPGPATLRERLDIVSAMVVIYLFQYPLHSHSLKRTTTTFHDFEARIKEIT